MNLGLWSAITSGRLAISGEVEEPGEILWQNTYNVDEIGPLAAGGVYPGLKKWDTDNYTVPANSDTSGTFATAVRTPSGIAKAGPDGGYAMFGQITVPDVEEHAAIRTFRNAESISNQELHYYGQYAFINGPMTIAGNGFLNIFEFKSRIEPAGTNKTSWNLGLVNVGGGTDMALRLAFNTDMDTGPFSGTPGAVPYFFNQYGAPMLFPVQEWVTLEMRLKPSENFDGLLQVWQNGAELIWDIGGNPYGIVPTIRTNQAGGLQTWAETLYGKRIYNGVDFDIQLLFGPSAIADGKITGTVIEPVRNLSECFPSKDTFIQKANPNASNTNSTTLIFHATVSTNAKHVLMQFDCDHLIGKTILTAQIRFRNAVSQATGRTINGHEIKAANANWLETATWNYANGTTSTDRWAGDSENDGGANAGCSVSGVDYEAAVGGTLTYAPNSPVNTLLTMDIDPAIVQRWANGANYGMIYFMTSSADFSVRSSNYDTDPSLRPYMYVTYED